MQDIEEKLDALLAQWEDAHEEGEPCTAESLCADCPELIEELRARIAALAELDPFIANVVAIDKSKGQESTIDRQLSVDDTNEVGAARSQRLSPNPVRGQRLGDYELLGEVARGGMGVVFKARQVKLNRIVALKMILSGELAGEEEVQRFKTEAEAAANLDHPGIVPIYEIGQHNGRHYFSMGFVEGQNLADRVNDGPLPPREAAEVMKKVAEAVAYAHEKGVIHRDIKPANVLLDANGEPRVTDFGLAKQVESDSDLTRTGAVMGTPSYMSPEQAAGKTDEVGPRADVYSLGAILYCLLTGRPPFQASSQLDAMRQVLECEPVPPRHLNSHIDQDLETICLKCLEKSPSRRYATALELAEEFERFIKGRPIVARPIGQIESIWRLCKRNPISAGLACTVAVALVLGTVVSVMFGVLANQHSRRVEKLLEEKDTLLEENKLLVDEKDHAVVESIEQRNRAEDIAKEASRKVHQDIAAIVERESFHKIGVIPRVIFEQREDNTTIGAIGPRCMTIPMQIREGLVLSTLTGRFRGKFSVVTEQVMSEAMNEVANGQQFDIDDLNSVRSLQTLARLTDADGFLVVSFDEQRRMEQMPGQQKRESTLEFVCELLRPDGAVAALESIYDDLTLSKAAYQGRSFELRRWNGDKLENLGLERAQSILPDDTHWYFGKGQRWEAFQYPHLNTPLEHPFDSSGFPFDLEVLVDGEVRQRQQVHGVYLVELNPDEEFSIRIRNDTVQHSLVALYVDGLNSINKELCEPANLASGLLWNLKPGYAAMIDRWYSVDSRMKLLPSDRFRVVHRDSGVEAHKSLHSDVGMITAIFYVNDRVSKGLVDYPDDDLLDTLKVIPPRAPFGSSTAGQMNFAGPPRGIILASATVYYRSRDVIKAITTGTLDDPVLGNR